MLLAPTPPRHPVWGFCCHGPHGNAGPQSGPGGPSVALRHAGAAPSGAEARTRHRGPQFPHPFQKVPLQCALDPSRHLLTSTSLGAGAGEAWPRGSAGSGGAPAPPRTSSARRSAQTMPCTSPRPAACLGVPPTRPGPHPQATEPCSPRRNSSWQILCSHRFW